LKDFVNVFVELSVDRNRLMKWDQEMLETIRRIVRCEQGATAVEYGLIVSLIVIAMLIALTNVSGTTAGMWDVMANKVSKASKF
jgi:pilus assembly protein Flp/PilA